MNAKLDAILAAVTSLASTVADQDARITALANGHTAVPATIQKGIITNVKAPKTSTMPASFAALDIKSTNSYSGTISKIHRKGGSCWLEETGETYYNGSKHTDLMPFGKLAEGDVVTIQTVTYAQDNAAYPTRTIVLEVQKGATVTNTASVTVKPVTRGATVAAATTTSAPRSTVKATETVGLAALQRSVPSSKRPEGCVFCGGSVHGNLKSGEVARDCLTRQFIVARDGHPFRPWKSEDLRALADYLDANTLTVSKGNDDTTGVTIRQTATTTAGASQTAATPAKASKSTKAPRVAKNAATAPTTESATGKLLKINTTGTKVQFQPVGKLFMWAEVSPVVAKLAGKFMGNTVTAEYAVTDRDGKIVRTITDMVRAPKA